MIKIRILFFAALFCLFTKSYSQFNVAYHQSNLPFVALGYEIGDRFSPELRINTDIYLDNINFEIVGTYDLIQKEDFDLYAGLGGILTPEFSGVVAPVGFVFYPFSEKRFGFHIELAPIHGEANYFGEAWVLRGSWGIRYEFGD